jgi:hypothetical protein
MPNRPAPAPGSPGTAPPRDDRVRIDRFAHYSPYHAGQRCLDAQELQPKTDPVRRLFSEVNNYAANLFALPALTRRSTTLHADLGNQRAVFGVCRSKIWPGRMNGPHKARPTGATAKGEPTNGPNTKTDGLLIPPTSARGQPSPGSVVLPVIPPPRRQRRLDTLNRSPKRTYLHNYPLARMITRPICPPRPHPRIGRRGPDADLGSKVASLVPVASKIWPGRGEWAA